MNSFVHAFGWINLCLCVGVLGHTCPLDAEGTKASQKHAGFAPTCRARERRCSTRSRAPAAVRCFLSARRVGSRTAGVAVMCMLLMTDEVEPLHMLVWITACVKCLFSHGLPSRSLSGIVGRTGALYLNAGHVFPRCSHVLLASQSSSNARQALVAYDS